MKKSNKDKIRIAKEIIVAADMYKRYMLGNTYLYVFENRFIEVVYRKKDFRHLTGVDTSLSVNDFYKEAIKGTLTDRQIFFSARHPYDLCNKKMTQLKYIHKLTNSEILINETVKTGTTIFKFGLNGTLFTLCLDHDLDDSGIPQNSYYIAKSLRIEDCTSRSNAVFPVKIIFRRAAGQKYYDRITYINSTNSLQNLPDIKDKLHPLLTCSL